MPPETAMCALHCSPALSGHACSSPGASQVKHSVLQALQCRTYKLRRQGQFQVGTGDVPQAILRVNPELVRACCIATGGTQTGIEGPEQSPIFPACKLRTAQTNSDTRLATWHKIIQMCESAFI